MEKIKKDLPFCAVTSTAGFGTSLAVDGLFSCFFSTIGGGGTGFGITLIVGGGLLSCFFSTIGGGGTGFGIALVVCGGLFSCLFSTIGGIGTVFGCCGICFKLLRSKGSASIGYGG
jgi:hypothetical protein